MNYCRFSGAVYRISAVTIAISCIFLARSATATVHYAWSGGDNTWPYSSWSSAANVVQDAIDACAPGDSVLVSNSVSFGSGRVMPGSLRSVKTYMVVDKPVTVTGLAGPWPPFMHGGLTPGARGAYVTNGAIVEGFTIWGFMTPYGSGDSRLDLSGAGVLCEAGGLVRDCFFSDCTADFAGGGVRGGTISNCTFQYCWARNGGAAAFADLQRCTALSNGINTTGAGIADVGGGLYDCSARDCFLATTLRPAAAARHGAH